PLLFIDHVDYQFGNVHDVAGVAKVAHQYDIPVLVNGAYSVGIMPVDGRALGADFVVGSGHKSMAAPAPSGLLATTDEHAEEVFRVTKAKGDVTGRTFGIKEVEMMGCTLMGVTVVGMMASFPHVRERVKSWEGEVVHSQAVTDALLSIEGTKVLSDYPRQHTLTRVDSRGSFDTVARQHKKRGYFLSSELRRRGITGIIPGSTRIWKLNTFGLTTKQVQHVGESFVEVARENGLNII
ncbi:MAG: aminotransferase class V-fold PLP-dependent enzyme, partial [Methanomicrobiales archaeon]|nr:aminotransferase class V-fold PLP-dependent enzyme [Methanomicrobiales archaeon]